MKPFIALVLATFIMSAAEAQKVNPIVKDFGSVWEVPFAKETPSSKMKYNIVVDITDAAAKPDTINVYLEAVATLMNLHGVGGVPAKNIHIIVVLHKAATYSIFTNEMYQQRFKMNNPNLPLIAALKEAGVEFFTCGQTLFRGKIEEKAIIPEVTIATSALTTLTTYQLKGYAMINFK
ncbi:MAG: DsrE family protein [Chitinophagaceae bacterium]|nr:DsrE family protein [Chitinophagaceae bacterium]